MNQVRKTIFGLMMVAGAASIIVACSKGGDSPSPNPPSGNTCASKNITVTLAPTNAAGCTGGTVTVTAGGSTGFTYNIDGGTFQASNTFSNVAAGEHTIIAKDGEGCTKSATVTVTAAPSGVLFAAVKALINTNCVSCHAGAAAQGGISLSTDCNIINASARIKARAVDGNPSFMPQGGQLSATDKKKITDWITAGGKYTD
jgi:mono/diheme cytochrome c family protein